MKHNFYSDIKLSHKEKGINFFLWGEIMNFLSWILIFIPTLKILQREMKDQLTISISKLIMYHRKPEVLGGQQPETLQLAKE